MTQYNFDECSYLHSNDGTKTIRCPECKNHGENISLRRDCKNLIKMEDGTINQCQCYSKEHKDRTIKCPCGREIKKEETYFIRIESGEQPEVFCELCVSIN